MAFRINTNVASLSATLNAQSNQKDLSNSISRLSSGLRIQSAADDASGMYIADSLKSQSNSLYQAIRNGNDAIGIVQTADKAMDEQIKIIDTIRVKAIQAANDSQNVESRRAIQSDISRLLDELDNITNTTSFNGQKLLNGNFINKQFQIGAYSNETVKLSIENTHSKAIGHTHFLATSSLVFKDKDFEKTNFKMKLDAVPGFLEGIEFEPISGKEILNDGLGVIVDKINAYSDKTGVKAKVKNEFLSDALMFGTKFFQNSIQSLKINGELIGTNIKFETGDPDNVLIDAINAKSDTTGVKASNIGGRLSMIAE
ncbi:MAG: flagellin hook IN motif-containing protein, partial [Campylobacter hyointestinalis]